MKFIYKKILFFVLLVFSEAKAQNSFFTDVPEAAMKTSNQKRLITPNKFRSLSLDTVQIKQLLAMAPMEFTDAAKTNNVTIAIPMPDGSFSHFTIVESPIMEPALAAKFPNIKTYSGQGIEDRTATIKIDWTDFGFHAMIYSAITGSTSIDPYARDTKIYYISYSKEDLTPKPFKESGVEVSQDVNGQINTQRTQSGFCSGGQLRTYRLALACTGEYAVAVAGSSPTKSAVLSAMITSINRVGGVYEREVSIRFTMVDNTNIIYLNATTDPYTNNDGNVMLSQNQLAIDGAIGAANYDIGHVFSTGGGGVAYLQSVCNTTIKAGGVTGLSNPTGDGYDIDFVAHEIGHQFGGHHTFNSIIETTLGNPQLYGCSVGTRSASYSVEPGSGVTIMGYAGTCGADDLTAHSIPYFHSISQIEIGNYVNTSTGNTCAVTIATGNTPPVVNAGADYTIPASTPFKLTGSATDANNDAVTFSWEEIDPGTSGGSWNSGNKPYFRSFSPVLNASRTFPQISDVANSTTTKGEILPTTAQTLNFRLTARDNRNGGGGVCSDEMVLTVAASSGFAVTSQWGGDTWTANGSNTASILWNVAGTDAAPISCTAVDILFSADGGLTFPYTLLSNTPNDGSQDIIIPAVPTTKGRVMVRARNNIFFNINTANITVISSSCTAEGAAISPTTSVTAPAGTTPLNLSLNPQYATAFAASGTIATTDPTSTLVVASATNTCVNYTGNIYSYDTYTFAVSVSGNYTFQRTGSGSIFSFYTNSYNPASPCSNFITSNYTDGVGPAASVVVNLTAGVTYVLVEGVYWTSPTTPANPLPFTYSFAVTATPVGGGVYNGSGVYVNPGASFGYNYVIVDNATNTIKAISSSANLTNATTYPNGTSYTVYGISFNNSHAATLASYVGNNLSALTSALASSPSTLCANLSKNSVTVVVGNAVPVTFLGLKARKQDKKVQLDWATASEINSDYFLVQRSSDAINFTTELGKLTAAGNSISVKNYSIADAQPLKGWGYYRIKQVDKDGHVTYSNVAAINFDKTGDIVIIYPNPTKDKLTIEYTSTKAGNIQLQVLDSKGSLIINNNANVIVGRNTNILNVSSLSKGVYVLRCMDAENNVNFVKFIKE